MLIREPFQEIFVKSFDEFEKRYHTIRSNRNYRDAVFRGQSEANWGLVPSIFRDTGINLSSQIVKDRIFDEFIGVKNFVRLADRIGMGLPGDIIDLLNYRKSKDDCLKSSFFTDWYHSGTNKYIELICISQHHGVSTRFLDFSFNAYVALYFAAEGAVNNLLYKEEEDTDKLFSLWMIDRLYLFNPDCVIKHFEVSTARNKYLNSQRGLFLYPKLPNFGEDTVKKKLDIKEIAINNSNDIANNEPGHKNIWPVIIQFNFPYSLCAEILREIDDRHDVNMTTIKPNLDNIIPYKKFREKINNLWSQLK